jgi:F-type H+-transporting ATPase subunit c
MTELGMAFLAAGFGAAIAVIGGAYGISKLASAAMEGIARQPEAAGDIRGAMIITAAMIEGVALLALVICFLLSFKTGA